MTLAHNEPAAIVTDDTLRYLGLDRRNPATVALVLVAERYGLDPLLGHISMIKTAEGPKPYITRDGMLDIAHRSGQFDGMEVVREHDGETGWGRTVSVWRKDMSHPFTYSGGCGKQEHAAKRGNGPEMALARAERRALKRAFRIPTSEEVAFDDLSQNRTPHDADLDEVPAEIVDSVDGHGARGEPVTATAVSAHETPVALSTDPATGDQLGTLAFHMDEAGFGDRNERLAWATAQVGRDIASSKELTKAEASQLIDLLEQGS